MAIDDHVLITGGAGFVGSHLTDEVLRRPHSRVTVLDRLSTGGSLANLEAHDTDPRFRFVRGDVRDDVVVRRLVGDATSVVHAAAETHVDRSIDDPRAFLDVNVLGTQTVLEAALAWGRRVLVISTDEVYGPGDPGGGLFDEDHPLVPKSPYAVSKAAADLLGQAYVATYGADVTVVRGTNAYGPRQIERVVPTYVVNALEGNPVPVYGQGRQRREFLHVADWARAALMVLDLGEPGRVYNIGAGTEIENIELARQICRLAGAPEALIEFVGDRPGHDFRYGVRSDRLSSLGWRPEVPFDRGLADTVEWYREHLEWLRRAHEVDVITSPRPAGTGA